MCVIMFTESTASKPWKRETLWRDGNQTSKGPESKLQESYPFSFSTQAMARWNNSSPIHQNPVHGTTNMHRATSYSCPSGLMPEENKENTYLNYSKLSFQQASKLLHCRGWLIPLFTIKPVNKALPSQRFLLSKRETPPSWSEGEQYEGTSDYKIGCYRRRKCISKSP